MEAGRQEERKGQGEGKEEKVQGGWMMERDGCISRERRGEGSGAVHAYPIHPGERESARERMEG